MFYSISDAVMTKDRRAWPLRSGRKLYGNSTKHSAWDNIGQIAIVVQDLERAVTYYRDKLGMQFLFRAGTLAFFDCAGTRLMLSTPEPGQDPQRQLDHLLHS